LRRGQDGLEKAEELGRRRGQRKICEGAKDGLGKGPKTRVKDELGKG